MQSLDMFGLQKVGAAKDDNYCPLAGKDDENTLNLDLDEQCSLNGL